MMFRSLVLVTGLLYSCTSLAASIPKGETVTSCGDIAGWPPYTYVTPSNKTAGYDVDILDRILSKHGLQSEVSMFAWKRCLRDVEDGNVSMALSSAFNAERDKTYLFTRHYYTITPSYFFVKKRFPKGPNIKSVEDFNNYTVCGLLGYNYDNFGVPADIIDTGAKTFEQMVEKVGRGRCDVFLTRSETFLGFANMGVNFVKDYGLGFHKVPNVNPEKFYLMISRKYKYAAELKKIIDAELDVLEAQGEFEKIVEQSTKDMELYF